MAKKSTKAKVSAQETTVSRFESALIINRWLLHQLGAPGGFAELKPLLKEIREETGSDGLSRFYGALAGRTGLQLSPEKLAEYDRRLLGYETRLEAARGSFSFKYYQYLALLVTEILLDRLTSDPEALRRDINSYMDERQINDALFLDLEPVTPEDLRQFAFYMATGSGKTLVMHANFWQILYYLRNSAHPEALVRRDDRKHIFRNVLLITPSEGMSDQHMEELRLSGISAKRLVEDSGSHENEHSAVDPVIKVIEIHKLILPGSSRKKGEGVSIPIDSLGNDNLVFVDEGHKGTGTEAGVWKTVQKSLSTNGLLFEYSATYAQAIAAAGRNGAALISEYGKSVVFDYSYRHFHGDGYGKDFSILNKSGDTSGNEDKLMLANLLSFYQQVMLFNRHREAYRAYNIDQPLWVLLGTTVGKNENSDVVKLVQFLKRFLEQPNWSKPLIRKLITGKSGLRKTNGEDLFKDQLAHLVQDGAQAESVYENICASIFHGKGAIEVRELKNAPGELGIRVSGAKGTDYFAVINIGEVADFRKKLEEGAAITAEPDRISASHFHKSVIEANNSPVYMLIGAKKFIEGWSCWRVSSMGLLNVGKGIGSQIIQLFGRGVRLKGKDMSLKRSSEYPDVKHPPGIETLETLSIYGWNADYLKKFRDAIDTEDVARYVASIDVEYRRDWPELPIYATRNTAAQEVWILAAPEAGSADILLDRRPGFSIQSRTTKGSQKVDDIYAPEFHIHDKLDLLDLDLLYADLLKHKTSKWGDIPAYIPRSVVSDILKKIRCIIPRSEAGNVRYLQGLALEGVTRYADKFFKNELHTYELQAGHVRFTFLPRPDDAGYKTSEYRLVEEYRIFARTRKTEDDIRTLLTKKEELMRKDGGDPLPRLHLEQHLFDPLLTISESDEFKNDVTIIPTGINEGEIQLIKDIRMFWEEHHAEEPFCHFELFLLRNSVKSGIKLFHDAGFFPDFVLWIKDKRDESTRVVFLEPHGMVHEKPRDSHRYAAIEDIVRLNASDEFRNKKTFFDGFILPVSTVKNYEQMGEHEIEKVYPHLLFMKDEYVRTILTPREVAIKED